jgi:hypothetical protein
MNGAVSFRFLSEISPWLDLVVGQAEEVVWEVMLSRTLSLPSHQTAATPRHIDSVTVVRSWRCKDVLLFFSCCGGAMLNAPDTSTIIWPVVLAHDDE